MPAAIPNRRSTQLRINEVIYAKAKAISERESRNLNSQLEYFTSSGRALSVMSPNTARLKSRKKTVRNTTR